MLMQARVVYNISWLFIAVLIIDAKTQIYFMLPPLVVITPVHVSEDAWSKY